MKKKINVLELFSGAGGTLLGLEQAGFDTIAAIDIDKIACQTLKKNRPKLNVFNCDIKNIADTGISKYVDVNKVDLISAGFPCQPFSYSGKKRGLNDTRGTVFYSLVKIIKDVKPKMFMIENVKGLVSHDKGKTFNLIISILENLDYKIKWKIMNALDHGVAQKRNRIVVIGIRKDLNLKFDFPNKNLKKLTLKDVLRNVPHSKGLKYSKNKHDILKMVPPGGCWRDLPNNVAKFYMKRSYYLSGGRTGIARRLSWDEPSLTLTCSPIQKQTERCHPDETRPFTIREYARIQSFPDEWRFEGSVYEIYKQIGNAVPVEMARRIGEKIYQSLGGIVK